MAKHGVTDFLRIFEDVGTTFFDIETDLLVTLDEQGNISRTNPAFQRVLGYHEADVFGVALIRLVNVDDWARFIKSGVCTRYRNAPKAWISLASTFTWA